MGKGKEKVQKQNITFDDAVEELKVEGEHI